MMVDIIDTKQISVELISLADIFSKFFFCCLRVVRKSAFDFKYRLIEFVSKYCHHLLSFSKFMFSV